MTKKLSTTIVLIATLALAACVSLPSDVSAMVNTVEEAINQPAPDLQDDDPSNPQGQSPDGPQQNGPDNPGGPGGQGEGNRPERTNPIAEALGMTQEEFKAALESGQTVEELADDAGIDLAEVIFDDFTERMAQAVEDGRLTQEEADQKLAEMQERIDNGELPIGPGGPGGHGKQDGPGGQGGPGGEVPGSQNDGDRPERTNPIAEALGMTQEEFKAALESGQTVEELADDAGIDLAEVIFDDFTERMAQAVEDGRLTQEEADQKLAEMQERIDNGELPIGPGGPGGLGGQGRPGGQGGPDGSQGTPGGQGAVL